MLKVVCLSALAYASAAPIINDRDAASPQLPSAAPITDTGTSEARFRPMVRARAPTRARALARRSALIHKSIASGRRWPAQLPVESPVAQLQLRPRHGHERHGHGPPFTCDCAWARRHRPRTCTPTALTLCWRRRVWRCASLLKVVPTPL